MLKHLKKNIHKISSFLGVAFYTKTQSYHFDYKVTLKNNSQDSKRFSLVVPIVTNTDKQQLSVQPRFLPLELQIQTDEVFGNTYGVWDIELKPQECKVFKQSFEVKITPNLFKALNPYHFDDYSKLDEKIKKTFLTANKYVVADDQEIRSLAQEIKGEKTDVLLVAKTINDFVMKYLTYGKPILGLYSSREALERKEVDCGGFDTFFVALCQAAGIPARVVCGFWTQAEKNFAEKSLMHAWAEFMLPDGQWVPVDPSTEQLFQQGRTKKSGRFGFVGSDRVIFSRGCDVPLLLNGKTFSTDILQNPLIYPEQKEIEMGIDCYAQCL